MIFKTGDLIAVGVARLKIPHNRSKFADRQNSLN